MARDSALMDRARESGETVLSVYSWSRPTLSLGRNQKALGRYILERIEERGLDIVRRPTGGRALLHSREVTYSVTAPASESEPPSESYGRINRILINGLGRLGIDAVESRTSGPAPHPDDLPCFAAHAQGELIANGAKLVGSAQVRENGALLQHGSILIEDDQHLITAVLAKPPGDVLPSAATLAHLLGRIPEVRQVAEALFEAVKELEDPGARLLNEEDLADSTRAALERYTSKWWTWRR